MAADFGTPQDGLVRQKASFDWIAGTTPAFAQYRQMDDLLGARFIDLHWETGDRQAMALQAAQNNAALAQIKLELATEVQGLLDGVRLTADETAPLTDEQFKWVSNTADLTALLRSPVARDRWHNLLFKPEPEVGTDLAQGFSRAAAGLQALRVVDWRPHIARLAHDSIPHPRREIMKELIRGSVEEGKWTGASAAARSYEFQDLGELGVTRKEGTHWVIMPDLVDRMGEFVSGW